MISVRFWMEIKLERESEEGCCKSPWVGVLKTVWISVVVWVGVFSSGGVGGVEGASVSGFKGNGLSVELLPAFVGGRGGMLGGHQSMGQRLQK